MTTVHDLTVNQLITNRRRLGRLQELHRVIKYEVPNILNGNKFDMYNWVVDAKVEDGYSARYRTDFEPLKCDTAACACGWGALLSDKLKKAGLRWNNNSRILEVNGYGSYENNIAEFFGINRAVAVYLFFPGHSGTGYYDANNGYVDIVNRKYPNTKGEAARLEFIDRVEWVLNRAGVKYG